MWDNTEAGRKETERNNVEWINVEHNMDDNMTANKGIKCRVKLRKNKFLQS